MNDDLKNREPDGMDDLEAQLASLGVFGDDDDFPEDDPLTGFDFSDSDDPFAMLEAMTESSLPPESEPNSISFDDFDNLGELDEPNEPGYFDAPNTPDEPADFAGLEDFDVPEEFETPEIKPTAFDVPEFFNEPIAFNEDETLDEPQIFNAPQETDELASFDEPAPLVDSADFDEPTPFVNSSDFDEPPSFDAPEISAETEEFASSSVFDTPEEFADTAAFDDPISFDEPAASEEESDFANLNNFDGPAVSDETSDIVNLDDFDIPAATDTPSDFVSLDDIDSSLDLDESVSDIQKNFDTLKKFDELKKHDNPVDFDDFSSLQDFSTSNDLDSLANFDAPADMGGLSSLDDLDSLDGFDFGDQVLSAPSDGGDDDLDKQLEMLLMADQSADAQFEFKDVSASPSQSVYDPEVDGIGSVQYVKGTYGADKVQTEKLFANISPGKMVATFVLGVLIICMGAATAIVATFAVRAQQRNIDQFEHFTPVEIPVGTANNANFIFVNERAFIGGQPFTLARISAAYSGTFIYFEENFDPDDYIILLYNQARNLYTRTSFGMNSETGTVLQFAPLSRNTLFLTLHIQDRRTDEFVRFSYRFTAPPVHDAPAFINRPVIVEGSEAVMVRHAAFDSASSTIHFSFEPMVYGAGFRLNPDSEQPIISLRDRFSAPIPFTSENAMIYFEDFGVTVGTATFGPIISLEETVEIFFNDLQYYYPNPIVTVTPAQLFANDQWNPIPVQTGAFTLNLEGMAQQGSFIVLTLHGLDEAGRRRPTTIDMAIRADLADGSYVLMPGVARVSPYGSDVLFDMMPHGTRLRDVHVSQYSFIVNSVAYTMPSVGVPVQVTRFHNMPGQRRDTAERAVIEAFRGLLSYKSGETTRTGLVGLSQELLNSRALFDIFFEPRAYYGRAMFDVTVSAGDLLSNYDYVAVVEVTWAADEDGDLLYFREVFEVAAQSSDMIWEITEIRPLS